MIYTIGQTDGYEQGFKEIPNMKKKGRDLQEGFPGGSVWETYKEAKQHCDMLKKDFNLDYSVYGVLANWETETAPNYFNGKTWNDLLVDALLVKVDSNGELIDEEL